MIFRSIGNIEQHLQIIMQTLQSRFFSRRRGGQFPLQFLHAGAQRIHVPPFYPGPRGQAGAVVGKCLKAVYPASVPAPTRRKFARAGAWTKPAATERRRQTIRFLGHSRIFFKQGFQIPEYRPALATVYIYGSERALRRFGGRNYLIGREGGRRTGFPPGGPDAKHLSKARFGKYIRVH